MASGSSFMLSTECMPQHHGGVHALAVLSDDLIVSGSDDHTVCVWRRVGRDFACVSICTESEGQLRAVTALSPGPGFPTGGFAAASLDKRIRCYAFDPSHNAATLVHTLTGHTGGVISLGHTHSDGPDHLISGSWDGTARVWDTGTGALLHTLEGHENGTCVLGLPGGVIAVGSTGRKQDNAHVDFKLRLWRLDTGPGAPPGYALQRTVEDHDQAIRGLALTHDASQFVSVGNDGAVKVRSLKGDARVTFLAPLSQLEAKPYSVFGVAVTRDGRVAACVEDQSVRLYDLESGRTEDIVLPGVPWAVDSLANGDVVIACNQAGTSSRGHVYVWTKSADRAADDMQRATLAKDMEPPKRAEPSGGDGEEEIKVSGPYEHRAGVAGTSDGQYGFFRRADGSIMVCAWSSAAGAWTDIGVMEDAPGAGGSAAGEDPESGMTLAVDATGSKYDYMRGVTMETASGMRSLQLAWNQGDDPNSVAHAFIDKHGLGIDSFEQVRDFILEEQKKAGKVKRAGVEMKRYEHFPTTTFVDLVTVDWTKLLAKLRELNTGIIANADPGIAAGGMTKADDDAIAALVDVLAATSRYHSSTVPRTALNVLHRKLMLWPTAQLLPVFDLLRMLVVHLDAAEGVAEVMGGAFITRVLSRIAETRSKPELRAVTLLSARTLFNSMKQSPTRRLVMARLSDVLDATADLLNHDHDTVKAAAAVLCHNLAHAFLTAYRAASDTSPVTVAAADVEQFVAVVTQNLANVKQPEAALSLVQALGTVCLLDAAFARTASSLDANASLDAVVAACPASASLKDAVIELRGILATSGGGGGGAASARSK